MKVMCVFCDLPHLGWTIESLKAEGRDQIEKTLVNMKTCTVHAQDLARAYEELEKTEIQRSCC